MAKILVTGAAGFIGSVVSERLLDEGYEVIGIDNFQEGNRSSVLKNVMFFEGNYGDSKLLNEIFRNYLVDCVFHFAAETTIEYSMSNPSIYFNNNVVNGIVLLDSMVANGVKKMIFSSTAAVYGEPKYVPVDENHEKKPVNSYGSSKLIYENILDWYGFAYGLKFNLFRYFNAAGATSKSGENRKHENHLLPLIFKSILDLDYVLNVYGNDYNTKDGTCVRDYVNVKDIANAHILGLYNLEKIPNAKYNLGSAKGYTVLEVIKSVEEITKKNVKWRYKNRRVGDPDKLVASNELAIKELGWDMKESDISTIIIDAYKWFDKTYLRKKIY